MASDSENLEAFLEYQGLFEAWQTAQAPAQAEVSVQMDALDPQVFPVAKELAPEDGFATAYLVGHFLTGKGVEQQEALSEEELRHTADLYLVANLLQISAGDLTEDEQTLLDNTVTACEAQVRPEQLQELLPTEPDARQEAIERLVEETLTRPDEQETVGDTLAPMREWLHQKLQQDDSFSTTIEGLSNIISPIEVDRPRKAGGIIEVTVYDGAPDSFVQTLKSRNVPTFSFDEEDEQDLVVARTAPGADETPFDSNLKYSYGRRLMQEDRTYARVVLSNGEVVYNRAAITVALLSMASSSEPVIIAEVLRHSIGSEMHTINDRTYTRRSFELHKSMDSMAARLPLPEGRALQSRKLIDGTKGYWIGPPLTEADKAALAEREQRSFRFPNGAVIGGEEAAVMRLLHLRARIGRAGATQITAGDACNYLYGSTTDQDRLRFTALVHRLGKFPNLPKGWRIQGQRARSAYRNPTQPYRKVDFFFKGVTPEDLDEESVIVPENLDAAREANQGETTFGAETRRKLRAILPEALATLVDANAHIDEIGLLEANLATAENFAKTVEKYRYLQIYLEDGKPFTLRDTLLIVLHERHPELDEISPYTLPKLIAQWLERSRTKELIGKLENPK